MRVIRWAIVFVVVASLGPEAHSGLTAKCEDSFVIFPDGSGRVALSLSEPAAGGHRGIPRSGDWIEEILATSHGIAAITDSQCTTSGGWVTSSMTVWFDDANAVRLMEAGPDRTPTTRLAWSRDGDGFRLELTGGMVMSVARAVSLALSWMDAVPPGHEESARRIRADTLRSMKDVESKTQVRVPGAVLAAEGLAKTDPRTVVARLSGAEPEIDKRAASYAARPSFTVRCGPSAMTSDDIEKFKAELARAKETWRRDPLSSEVPGTVGSPLGTVKGEVQAWGADPSGARICAISSSGKETFTVRADVFNATGAAPASFVLAGCDQPDRAFLTEDGRTVIALAEITEFLGAYDATTGRCLWKVEADETDDSDSTDVMWAAAYLRDGLVALVRHGTEVRMLDAATGARRRSFREPKTVDVACAAPGTGRLVLGEGRTLVLVDATTGKRLWSIERRGAKEDDAWYRLVAGAAGGPILATRGDGEGSITEAIDPATGKILWSDAHFDMDVVSESGRIGATLRHDLRVYELSTRKLLTRIGLSEPLELSEVLLISADEKTLYVSTLDQRVFPVRLDAAPGAAK